MRNIGGESKFIAFFDECGDHSLTKVDRDFPLFLLAAVVVERCNYVSRIIPAVGAFKLRYWNHEGINLHSREIRKSTGPFSFLLDAGKRERFTDDLGALMKDLPFTLFIAAIRKDRHLGRYGRDALNPYDLAMEFALERIVHFLAGAKITELPCVVEGRGRNEDAQLERVFYRVMSYGTFYQPRERFRGLECPLVFRNKRDNIAGIQLADLCAHPCARHVMKPDQPNRAYDIAQAHVYHEDGVCGWKVFP